jgi:hypothetical protein
MAGAENDVIPVAYVVATGLHVPIAGEVPAAAVTEKQLQITHFIIVAVLLLE